MSQERARRKTQRPTKPHAVPALQTSVAVDTAAFDTTALEHATGTETIHRMMQLQRTVGNRSAQQLMGCRALPKPRLSREMLARTAHITRQARSSHIMRTGQPPTLPTLSVPQIPTQTMTPTTTPTNSTPTPTPTKPPTAFKKQTGRTKTKTNLTDDVGNPISKLGVGTLVSVEVHDTTTAAPPSWYGTSYKAKTAKGQDGFVWQADLDLLAASTTDPKTSVGTTGQMSFGGMQLIKTKTKTPFYRDKNGALGSKVGFFDLSVGTEMIVDTAKKITVGTPPVEWTFARRGLQDGYIRSTSIDTAVVNARETEEGDALDDANTVVEGVSDTTGGTGGSLTDGADFMSNYAASTTRRAEGQSEEDFKEVQDKASGEAGGKTAFAGEIIGGVEGIGMILGIVPAIKSLTEKDWKGGIAGISGALHGALKTAGSVSRAVEKGKDIFTGVKDGIAKTVGGSFGAASDLIDGVKGVYNMIKAPIVLLRKAIKGTLTFDDAVNKGVDTLQGLASAVSAGLKTAKGIIDLMGGATSALASGVAGVGIVISVIDIIKQVYDMVRAIVRLRRMESEKKKQQAEIITKYASLTKAKTSFFSRTPSTEKEIDDAQFNLRLHELEQKDKNGTLTPLEAKEFQELREFDLTRSLKKRHAWKIADASVNIFSDFLSIGGDIAMLTGQGAPVGIGLKVAAVATRMVYSGGKWIGGKIRDKWISSKKGTTDWRGRAKAADFSAGKTSGEQLRSNAFTLLSMAENTRDDDGNIDPAKVKRFRQFADAAGVNLKKVDKAPDGISKFLIMLKGMQT